MIAAALTLYAILSAGVTALAVCFFVAGARSDEQQRQYERGAKRAGVRGFHKDADT